MQLKEIKSKPLDIKYGGKTYTIDLDKELIIDDSLLNSQIGDIPRNYAFLCLMRDRYINRKNILEAQMNQAYSQAWVFYKEADSRMSNELATQKASTNKKYLSIKSKYLKVLDKANVFTSLCKAYETRERMIQTLSSNLRKQS